MQTVVIGVIIALDKSSIFPEGSDWTTMSPFFASTIGIQLALFCLFTRISVSDVKQAVPLLPCLLASWSFLHFSIEAAWAFVRVGSCSVFSASTVSVLFAAGFLPVSRTSVGAIPVQLLWKVGISVKCG